MIVLTPAERRAGLLLVLLLALGAVSDWWQSRAVRRPAPADTAAIAEPVPARVAPTPAAGDAAVDLNRASARELDDLPGVGPVLAARILEHRRRFGSFRAVEDLRAVRGIGPRLFERLKSRVRVDSAGLAAASHAGRDTLGLGRPPPLDGISAPPARPR